LRANITGRNDQKKRGRARGDRAGANPPKTLSRLLGGLDSSCARDYKRGFDSRHRKSPGNSLKENMRTNHQKTQKPPHPRPPPPKKTPQPPPPQKRQNKKKTPPRPPRQKKATPKNNQRAPVREGFPISVIPGMRQSHPWAGRRKEGNCRKSSLRNKRWLKVADYEKEKPASNPGGNSGQAPNKNMKLNNGERKG